MRPILIEKEKIQQAKEKLGNDMAKMIAEELGAADFDERNLKMCCPFHKEDTPSFIWNKKALSFRCFGACGRSYDIIDIYMSKGLTYIEAVQKLFEKADIPYAFGERNVKTKRAYRYPKEIVCTNKDRVYAYLEKRKISRETTDYLDIREDEHGNIVFNYYDTNDTLTMVKYRPSRKVEHGENKNWCQPGADTTPLLYNMNRINVGQPLLITSGELDCAAAIEAGWKNAVSIPLGDRNLDFCDECFDWLEQFSEIIICPDNDESGNKFCREVTPRLGSWRCKIAIVPKDCKDINEALFRHGKDCVLDFIVHAQDTPITSVVDLSDVEDIDLDKIDGVYTGLSQLDSELMRIFYGTLTIVSGTPGSGKTSFLYQLICQAMDQDKNIWLYSRELPVSMTRNWMNYILAGNRNVEERTDPHGAKYYIVPKSVKNAVGDCYRGKWYTYKDDASMKIDDILESMESVVRKSGCRLLILDNLMMLDIAANETNELQKQTETITKLIQFAMKFNVAVILVAHPRKLQAGSEVGIYDISGTANIINLAHRTIGLKRVTSQEKRGVLRQDGKGYITPPCPYDVMVTVIKDRIRGRTGDSIGLYYDQASRRFFSNPEEYDHHYMWDKKEYTESVPYPVCDRTDEVYGAKVGSA